MARRAVVTAGTGGIGLETAIGLTKAGYAVTGGRAQYRTGREGRREDQRRGRGARPIPAGRPRLARRCARTGRADRGRGRAGRAGQQHRRHVRGPHEAKAFDDVEPPGGYYGFHWYGRAKLAYTLDLAQRLEGGGVAVFAADPGGAATDMTDGTMRKPKIVSPGPRLLWPLVRRKFTRSTSGPASAAARSSILAATSETLPTGTVVGAQGAPVTPTRAAADPRIAEAVRRLSERHAPLVQVPDGISN
jgi:hypothetical protein